MFYPRHARPQRRSSGRVSTSSKNSQRRRKSRQIEPLEHRRLLTVSALTDKADYLGGSTAFFTASGFDPGAAVQFQVVKTSITPSVVEGTWSVTDGNTTATNPDLDGVVNGSAQTSWYVDPSFSVGSDFSLTATGLSGGVMTTATTTFSDSEGASLAQAANGSPSSPLATATWQNGNINENNSHYAEGDSVPFQMDLTGLTGTTHTLIIQYDYTVGSGEHAYDYLTSFDRTTPNNQTVANPLIGTGVSGTGTLASATSTFAIPTDTNINGVVITPAPVNNPPVHSPFSEVPGVMAMFDNAAGSATNKITNVYFSDTSGNPTSPPAEQGSALTGTMTIQFTTTQSEVVMSWGGHIASALDWGQGNSATAISGSPYHMRLVALDGGGGNQDRSLKASAVAGDFITVAKITNPSSDTTTQFPFTLTGPNNVSQSFNLTGGSHQMFGPFFDGTYVVTETVPSSWNLTNIAITGATGTPNLGAGTETITLTAGEVANVTYTDTVIASPTFTTVQTPSTATAGSVIVSDSATFSGGNNHTGTITFDLQNASNVEVPGYTQQTDTVTAGNNTYSATNETVSLAAGTYHWHVVYSGDANNHGFTLDNELLTVSKASPTFTTIQTPTTATAGSVIVSDSATFSGGFNHTGTITFDLQNASNVEVPGYTQQTDTVTAGNNTYSATNETVSLAAGTYHWHVVYSGDANNNGFTLDNELLTVSKASPTFTTIQTPTTATAGSVIVSDSATFSGGFNHTGTITFDLQNASNVEVPGYTQQTDTVTAGSNTYSATNETVSLAVGTYHWHVVYSGDANNNGFTLDNETLAVSPASPTFMTTQTPSTATAGSVIVSDSATFSGGFNHTGTITFDLQNASNVEVPGYIQQTDTVTAGSNTYSATNETVSLAVGTYHWHVVYSGDANNNGFTLDNETLAVSPASPTFTTTQSPTSFTAGSVTVSDSATFSGGFNHTGTITFDLQDASNVEVPGYTQQTDTVTAGSNTYSATNETVTLANQTYHWHVVYSGDVNNNGFTLDNELLTGGKASPTFTTTQTPSTATAGSVIVSDVATFSGGLNHTGTITFDLQNASNVEVPGYIQQTDTVTAGSNTYSATNETVSLAVGTYHWHVVYSGDANNNGFTLDNETLAVSPASPTFMTTQTPSTATAGSVIVSDSATFSGGFNHTGTITFDLQNASNVEVPGYIQQTDTVTAGSNTYSATNETVSLAVGTYHWHVVYSGDANNNGFTLDNETLAVSPASPTFTTTQTPTTFTAGSVIVSDSATFSGGFNHTGTITFDLQDASNVEVPGYTQQTDTVTAGSNTYSATNETVTLANQTYHWHVVYSGDVNNNGFTLDNELLTGGKASPMIVTLAGGTVVVGSGAKLTDSATLSGGINETGTITFTLSNPGNTVVDTETVMVNGNGTYSTPAGFLPTATGSYLWSATYSGDSNNNSATDNGQNENETVGPASPTIVTLAGGTVVVGSGAKLTDSATLSGGINETGTITFTLFNPGNTVVDTETVAVNGDGTYSTPVGFLPTATGTYLWSATYSGDSNNNSATDNGQNENETVGPASPTIVTLAGGTVVVGSGAKLTDSATLSGGINETGTITFTLFNPGNTVVDTETVAVNGDGTYSTPVGFLPTATGTYLWSATYSGDSNNNSATDNGQNENETVGPASPTLVTLASESPGNVVGATIPQDSALLSGGFNETGTITFTLHAPNNTVVDTQTVAVNGGGTYSTSNVTPAMQVGTYTWTVLYSGDSNNNGANDQGGSAEQVTVIKASPTISTIASAGGVVGSALLTDQAILAGGDHPTGTITFTLTAPNQSIVSTQIVSANGDGTYTTPNSVLATQVGIYTWSATYSGDALNNSATDNGENESTTVVTPNFIVIGEDAAAELNDTSVPDQVVVVDKSASNKVLVQFNAYDPSYRAGVRVALADMDGDGIPEIITAPGRLYNQEGPAHQNEIRVFKLDFSVDPNHPTVHELTQFRVNAYPASVNGGIQVAVGDVNNDGFNDIVTAPTRGPEEIKVFLNQNGTSINTTPARDIQQTQYGFSKSFIGGAVIGVADMGTFNASTTVNAKALDGYGEVVVGNGSGMAPIIDVINLGFNHPNPVNYAKVVRTMHPFNSTMRGGIFFDLGRVNSDAIPDLVVGTGNGGKSMVEVLNGCNGAVITGPFQTYFDTNPSTPKPDNQQAPVRVALLDTNGDGIADEIVTVQGTDGKSRNIKFWNPLTGHMVDQAIQPTLHEDDPTLFGDYFEEFIAVSSLSSQQHRHAVE